jgi:hypothetical protein
MSRRKSVIGIAVLFALVVSAFAASSASAEDRAYNCEQVLSGTHGFAENDGHCVTPSVGTGKGFIHVLTSGTTTIVGTNAKTASSTTAAAKSILRGTLSGLETELECTTVGGSGSLTNAATSVSGTGTIEYSGCVVLKPAGRGCKVTNGKVTTNSLSATTVGQTGTNLKFAPASGTEFAGVSLESCLNNKPPTAVYPVSGSLVASTSGATTTTTEAGITAQGTLTFGGNPSGLEGALTISMSGGSGPAISLTP